MSRRLAILAVAVAALAAVPATAGAAIGKKQIGTFENPTYVTGAPGFPTLLFVVQQGGEIRVLKNGRKLGKPFLDIEGLVNFDGAERGLLSMAFPPDYRQTRRFYVYYNDSQGDIRVDEFKRRSATSAARGSRRAVIDIPHRSFPNHNGGQLQFNGNLLYFGTGDGGAGGDPSDNAQSKRSLLGKLIRIDPRPRGGRAYRIPKSNPFVGRRGRDEIYAYGLRNPFRFSFDGSGKSSRIAIADVGQDEIEEVNFDTTAGAKGANFGWDAFEGFDRYESPYPKGTTFPAFAYNHSRGGSCSVIGGYVVRSAALPSLDGRYVYADLCEGKLRSLRPGLGRVGSDRKVGVSVDAPTSFGRDVLGRIYVASASGPVYRLVQR